MGHMEVPILTIAAVTANYYVEKCAGNIKIAAKNLGLFPKALGKIMAGTIIPSNTMLKNMVKAEDFGHDWATLYPMAMRERKARKDAKKGVKIMAQEANAVGDEIFKALVEPCPVADFWQLIRLTSGTEKRQPHCSTLKSAYTKCQSLLELFVDIEAKAEKKTYTTEERKKDNDKKIFGVIDAAYTAYEGYINECIQALQSQGRIFNFDNMRRKRGGNYMAFKLQAHSAHILLALPPYNTYEQLARLCQELAAGINYLLIKADEFKQHLLTEFNLYDELGMSWPYKKLAAIIPVLAALALGIEESKVSVHFCNLTKAMDKAFIS